MQSSGIAFNIKINCFVVSNYYQILCPVIFNASPPPPSPLQHFVTNLMGPYINQINKLSFSSNECHKRYEILFYNQLGGGFLFYWYKSFFLPNQDIIFFIQKFNNKTVINERGIYLYLYSSLSCVVVCLFVDIFRWW